MKRWQFLLSLALSVCLVSAGCAAPTPTGPQPPEIAYGQDLCEGCGMVIDEARFAAATLTVAGKAHKFDDIGEMIIYHMEHLEEQAQIWFVHDSVGGHWIRGETAYFVQVTGLASPMGHGIVAFEDQAAAEKFAQEKNSRVLTLDELRVAIHVAVHG